MMESNFKIEDLARDPFDEFQRWFAIAAEHVSDYPNAMVLATVSPRGIPSARAVLLKGVDRRGFVFYTNYESRKASELDATKVAALNFTWPSLELAIRISGTVHRTSAEESDAYFASRPRESQIGGHRTARFR